MASSAENQPKQTKEGDKEAFSCAMELVMGIGLPMAMQAVAELGVFDIIGKAGPGAELSASEIVAQISTKNPDASAMMDRLLRLLVTHSVLNCSAVDGERRYSLTPMAKYFVSDQDGVSLCPCMTLLQDRVGLNSWYKLKDAILEGGVPFIKAYGINEFDYHGTDPRFNEVFSKGMYNHSSIVMKEILKFYKGFEHIKQLVDVGGGLGVTLNIIISKYPQIKGVNFDLPHVIKNAPFYTGVEHMSGDMVEGVPRGDAILMKWILHDWDDDHCLSLLKNCYKALPDDGKVIVIDAIMTEVPEISTAARNTSLMDAFMLIHLPGAKERTKQEFTALATGAGFKGINYACYVCNFYVMEFFK